MIMGTTEQKVDYLRNVAKLMGFEIIEERGFSLPWTIRRKDGYAYTWNPFISSENALEVLATFPLYIIRNFHDSGCVGFTGHFDSTLFRGGTPLADDSFDESTEEIYRYMIVKTAAALYDHTNKEK